MNENEKDIKDITEVMDVPDEYYSNSLPKLNISKAIKEGADRKEISIRKLADKIGLKHPQIIRVTSCENYNVDTLLKILDGLDLEIEIKPKKRGV